MGRAVLPMFLQPLCQRLGSSPPDKSAKTMMSALATASAATRSILGCQRDLSLHQETEKLKQRPDRRVSSSCISCARFRLRSCS